MTHSAESALSEERSKAELDFVTARMEAQRKHYRPRCWGRSSDALMMYGLGKGPRPILPGRTAEQIQVYESGERFVFSTRGGYSLHGDNCGTEYPHDIDDLNACERTYEMAPPWVQERMLPVLLEFRSWVLEGRNRYGEVICPPPTWGEHAPALVEVAS